MNTLATRTALLAALGVAALTAGAQDKATAPAGSDFVRFREDAKGAQLQTAIVSYRNADGVVVELIGAIHIADKGYYEKLNKRFTTLDALLYEMVGEALEAVEEEVLPTRKPAPRDEGTPDVATRPASPGEPSLEQRMRAIEDFLSKGDDKPRRNVAPKAPPPEEAPAEEAARERMSWLHPIYITLKNTLKLESQLEGIDYTQANFVHADMTARQFAAMQAERGEGFMQLWWRTVQAQIAQPDVMSASSPGLLKILEILCRPDSPTELKRLMGRMFDQVEKLMAGMEAERGSVIVVERNRVAMEVLDKQIAKGHKRLGIFYGAAHLTDMEQRLLTMGFKKENAVWLTAWDLPPEPPPVQPKTPPAVKAER